MLKALAQGFEKHFEPFKHASALTFISAAQLPAFVASLISIRMHFFYFYLYLDFVGHGFVHGVSLAIDDLGRRLVRFEIIFILLFSCLRRIRARSTCNRGGRKQATTATPAGTVPGGCVSSGTEEPTECGSRSSCTGRATRCVVNVFFYCSGVAPLRFVDALQARLRRHMFRLEQFQECYIAIYACGSYHAVRCVFFCRSPCLRTR